MLQGKEKEVYSKAFQMLWSIWKNYGIRHTDADAWQKVVKLSDEIIRLVPEDETMHQIARMLLLRLEQRADEIAKGEKS